MSHFLGTTEHMVLLAILRLGEGAYGASILAELEEVAGRAPSSGALSTTLDRLERKRLVESSYADGDEGRLGRPRRVVKLTAAGRKELVETQSAFRRLSGPLRPEEA